MPFSIVSGTSGEEVAVKAMETGAHDYVMKGNLTCLIPAIKREFQEAEERKERRRAEAALRESEKRYRLRTENTADDCKSLSVLPNPCFYD